MNETKETKEKTERNTVATIEEVKIEPLADNDLEKVVGGFKPVCSQFECCPVRED